MRGDGFGEALELGDHDAAELPVLIGLLRGAAGEIFGAERRGRGAGHLWEQTTLARATRGDILVGFGGSGPLLHPRQLVVIHDVTIFRHPEAFGRGYRALHKLLGFVLTRRAQVATVSQFSRRELGAVFGVPSELSEEDVKVIVVLRDGVELDPQELVDWCAGRMADFMVPRYIEYRESLPKTETGEKSASESLNITLDKAGKIFLMGKEVAFDALESTVKEMAQKNPQMQTVISADQETHHGDVVKVMDMVKKLGLTRFAIQIERR